MFEVSGNKAASFLQVTPKQNREREAIVVSTIGIGGLLASWKVSRVLQPYEPQPVIENLPEWETPTTKEPQHFY